MTVSQAPAVSEAPAVATPAAGGAALAALPSAVQDLARFFLSLSGSSSLGAAGGVAGVSAPAAGVGVQLCPSTSAGGAVAFVAATAIPADVSDPTSAPAAVPGVSGRQQRQEDSRPSRRRRRSSSDGTDRRSKKQPRGRSPSPSPSSRRRERHYRSSSSKDDRAEASPGGTLGNSRSAPTGDRSLRHDRSSAFDAVDFDRDDSFRSVLGLIRNFHAMEEPAGTPSTRCKTSLASIYGLMSETSGISPACLSPGAVAS